MPFLNPSQRNLAQALSELAYCNPFLPERIEAEQKLLGGAAAKPGAKPGAGPAVWSMRADPERESTIIPRLEAEATQLADALRDQLTAGVKPTDAELRLYEDAVLFVLYHRFRDDFQDALLRALASDRSSRISFYAKFEADARRYLHIPGVAIRGDDEVPHLFACFFQLRRAFHHIYAHIVGGSMATAKLRAGIWQSIFTHDMRRYRRCLFDRMGDIATLITGPTGTGKELVARAIGLSRYIPFDPQSQKFADDFTGSFHALNLSALSPTLIESELFGHRRGSFTGAVADRAGWLEVCKQRGTVFLDEIGELDPAIQVKLLRVLQSRTFQRLGDTDTRQFHGKIIAATNRDLMHEIEHGRFRQDFYYRLCSDLISTPSLREQLRDAPDELRHLVLFLTRRMVGDEADAIGDEVVAWIDTHMGDDYEWPGNIRELEQCVRNVMIRKAYHPPRSGPGRGGDGDDPVASVAASMRRGSLTADELLRKYCTMVYKSTGSYEAAAKRLKLDRRTVKAKIEPDLLAELNGD